MAIMLSDAGEYEGGLLEVSPPVAHYQLAAGEAIAWCAVTKAKNLCDDVCELTIFVRGLVHTGPVEG